MKHNGVRHVYSAFPRLDGLRRPTPMCPCNRLRLRRILARLATAQCNRQSDRIVSTLRTRNCRQRCAFWDSQSWVSPTFVAGTAGALLWSVNTGASDFSERGGGGSVHGCLRGAPFSVAQLFGGIMPSSSIRSPRDDCLRSSSRHQLTRPGAGGRLICHIRCHHDLDLRIDGNLCVVPL